ncbi:ATP-binding protein [Miltoncostaea marina]|uniref:ATP-binding protein n=1 Tax=Miltoncostaea marina TaxID=2843215 RepID=UPI001C3DCE69|nr:ATP-binding protein [Miltoncostaea marina]
MPAQRSIDMEEHYSSLLGDDPAEIAAVRRAVRDIAVRGGFDDRASDLVLALDEVIANAQEHGRPPIEVTAWVDGRLVVEVADVGEGFDRARVWRTHPPEPYGTRGRGLWIARQLTDLVTITTGQRGTTVRIELSPDPHIGA